MSRTDLPNTSYHHDDEIDLFELVATLWRHKWLIMGITILATLLAGVIAFFVMKPSYQSQATITPPNQYQITAVNQGLQYNDEDYSINLLKPDDIYKVMLQTLGSTNLQRQFFREYYLPHYKDDPEIKDNQQNFRSFQKNLSIQKVSDSDARNITLTNEDPQLAYELTSEFVKLADDVTSKTILENRKAEINALIVDLESSLKGLQLEMNAELSFELSELKNALETATALGIDTPMEKATELYQQGTHALASKIKFLEAQKGNYSRNNRYNTLSMMLDSYKAIQLPSADQFSTFTFNALPEVPEIPTKPNKKLIVIIGFLLGGMLGVIIVLLREAIRNYKIRKAAEA